jgi:RHS repeat-associated protein
MYQRLLDNSGNTLEERFRLFVGDRQVGEVVREDGADRTLYFHADHLGSTDTVSDSDGGAVSLQFDPFGSPIDPPNPEVTRVGFTGQDQDVDLAFTDMRGRVYDPVAGRFTTGDAIMQTPFWSQGLNAYSYCFNDPINHTDPTGFDSNADSGIGIPAWGGAVVGIAALQGFGAGAGAILGGVGGVGTNVVTSLLGGPGYGAGSAGSVTPVTPSASPKGSGVSRSSPLAGAQNQGGVGPTPGSPSNSDFAAERDVAGDTSTSGGGDDDDSIRNLPLKDGKYPVQHIPQRYLRILQPLFHHLHVNIASVPVIVKPIPQPSSGPVNAKTNGWVILIDPDYLAKPTTTDQKLFGTFAHEGTHVVQHYELGTEKASDARFRADQARYGVHGQYDIPPELGRLSIQQLNPIDPRFAVEAIAEQVKDLAYEAEDIGL